MNAAKMLALRSKCERNQVGCVITDRSLRRVLGNGYNGRAAGIDDNCPGKDVDPCGCLHAEANALIACGSFQMDKVLFVTMLPCENCSRMIINSGFSRVIYDRDHAKIGGLKLLKSAGILVEKYINL